MKAKFSSTLKRAVVINEDAATRLCAIFRTHYTDVEFATIHRSGSQYKSESARPESAINNPRRDPICRVEIWATNRDGSGHAMLGIEDHWTQPIRLSIDGPKQTVEAIKPKLDAWLDEVEPLSGSRVATGNRFTFVIFVALIIILPTYGILLRPHRFLLSEPPFLGSPADSDRLREFLVVVGSSIPFSAAPFLLWACSRALFPTAVFSFGYGAVRHKTLKWVRGILGVGILAGAVASVIGNFATDAFRHLIGH